MRAACDVRTVEGVTIPAPASGQLPTTASRARAIAPDLARGLMLLMIALANMPFHLFGREVGATSMHVDGGDVGDRIWQGIAIVAIDGRSYPLFAFLFGYGIWQLYRTQLAAGATSQEARRLLRRRHAWMLAFGAVHAALLWGGDIVGAYGLVGVLVGWLFLERRDRTLVLWSSVLGGLLVLGALAWMGMGLVMTAFGLGDLGGTALPQTAGIDSYPASVLARLAMWVPVTFVQGVFGLAVPVAVLLAILAARRGVLEEPERHRALLTRVAVGGIAIGWSTGVLAFLEHVDVIPVMPTTFWMLHTAAGVAGGLGYAALFGLVAARLARRPLGRVSRALTAVGKRSLTSYLLQSVLFAPVLSAWGLGLGGVLTEWQGALYALGVWLVTVAVAVALDAAGRRGPAETLLRRLADPRDAKAQPPAMRASASADAAAGVRG